MPTYGFACVCGAMRDIVRPIDGRDDELICVNCDRPMQRQLAAPLGRVSGRAVQGGGPDRFTADMLGIPLHDLPSGLKTTDPRA